ncbi:Hypothetical predicted protein [Lynx pardinus]|uniref:Uncharacterized protein n=1 Tax=Lynx pardinus TaxID=191816 RepID=A0A485NI21_LYNPA|nr:Hypothetical predicted protein [Lynx pardinus]
MTLMYRTFNSTHSARFGGQFFSLWFFQFGDVSHRLWTQDVTSSVTVNVIISVIVIGPNGFHQLSQSTFVFRVILCEGNIGAGLPVDKMP